MVGHGNVGLLARQLQLVEKADGRLLGTAVDVGAVQKLLNLLGHDHLHGGVPDHCRRAESVAAAVRK